jgi:hypothetical protein
VNVKAKEQKEQKEQPHITVTFSPEQLGADLTKLAEWGCLSRFADRALGLVIQRRLNRKWKLEDLRHIGANRIKSRDIGFGIPGWVRLAVFNISGAGNDGNDGDDQNSYLTWNHDLLTHFDFFDFQGKECHLKGKKVPVNTEDNVTTLNDSTQHIQGTSGCVTTPYTVISGRNNDIRQVDSMVVNDNNTSLLLTPLEELFVFLLEFLLQAGNSTGIRPGPALSNWPGPLAARRLWMNEITARDQLLRLQEDAGTDEFLKLVGLLDEHHNVTNSNSSGMVTRGRSSEYKKLKEWQLNWFDVDRVVGRLRENNWFRRRWNRT